MWIRLRRRRGITLNEPHVAAGRTNAREHNLGRKLEESLAQQRVLIVIQRDRAQKYRRAVGQVIKRLLLRLGFENDNVADFVFRHSVHRRWWRRRHAGRDRPVQLTHAVKQPLEFAQPLLH